MKLNVPVKEGVEYIIAGLPDEDAFNDEKPVPLERRISATHVLKLHGAVTSPDEWKGFEAEVLINNLGICYDCELNDKGYVGDGWCELLGKRVLIRLTVRPTIARDLFELWGANTRSQWDDSPEHRYFIGLRCDLVNLRHGDSKWLQDKMSYQIVRTYTDFVLQR